MCTDNDLTSIKSISSDMNFIESVINGMYDWVRVLDREDNILFINKAMADGLGGIQPGIKCYKALGRSAPCDNCSSRKSIFDGKVHEKEEIINNRIYSVMGSPIKNPQGEIIAVVEVLRDVTQTRQLQNQLIRQNKMLQDDLSMAKKLQCSLLPKQLPEDKLKFAFLYKPCEALGGDFLDIFMIDREHLGIYIADVSGHGVPASMLTVFLRSAINKKTTSPAKALHELYLEFNKSDFDHDFYITVFYAVINVSTQTMVYSNAGHNVCPIVFNSKEFQILMAPGIPISNWLEEPEYIEKSIVLNSKDRFFLYTDGIIEIRNPANEQYGQERLLQILLSSDLEPNSALKKLFDDACRFAEVSNTELIPDDITMALLEIK